MKTAGLLVLITGLLQVVAAAGDALPLKDMVEVANRHQMPLPPKGAPLVLAHTRTWSSITGGSNPRDPGLYSPAFLIKTNSDRSVVILRGTEEEELRPFGPCGPNDPLIRPFTDREIKPILGGYVADFYPSTLVCAVQLAARGDEAKAQRVWRRLAAKPWAPKNPRLLLFIYLYKHLESRLTQEPDHWPEIRLRMRSLFDDFPALLADPYRQSVFDGLTLALNPTAPAPAPDSTAALLLSWSRIPAPVHPRNPSPAISYRSHWVGTGLEETMIMRGAAAAPDLIALLDDRRVTTHQDGGYGKVPVEIVPLGRLAGGLLSRITGIPGQRGSTAEQTAEFRAWLEQSRQNGEQEALARGVFRREGGKITWINMTPVYILAEKHPERLGPLCEEFSRDAKPDTSPFGLWTTVVDSRLPKEAKVSILTGIALHGPLRNRHEALQLLAPLDNVKCAETLLPIIQALPIDSTYPYSTCPEAALARSVMLLDNDEIWRAFLEAAKRSSVGQRMEMLAGLYKLRQSKCTRRAVNIDSD